MDSGLFPDMDISRSKTQYCKYKHKSVNTWDNHSHLFVVSHLLTSRKRCFLTSYCAANDSLNEVTCSTYSCKPWRRCLRWLEKSTDVVHHAFCCISDLSQFTLMLHISVAQLLSLINLGQWVIPHQFCRIKYGKEVAKLVDYLMAFPLGDQLQKYKMK